MQERVLEKNAGDSSDSIQCHVDIPTVSFPDDLAAALRLLFDILRQVYTR